MEVGEPSPWRKGADGRIFFTGPIRSRRRASCGCESCAVRAGARRGAGACASGEAASPSPGSAGSPRPSSARSPASPGSLATAGTPATIHPSPVHNFRASRIFKWILVVLSMSGRSDDCEIPGCRSAGPAAVVGRSLAGCSSAESCAENYHPPQTQTKTVRTKLEMCN